MRAGAADLTAYDLHADQISAWRNRSRRMRYGTYFMVAALIAWSVEAIVIGDTDWDRISWASMFKSARQFMDVDFSILGSLLTPAIETALMATLGTLLGLVLAVPVAWLGAANISPLGKSSYAFGRALMTMSRSVHELVWALIFVAAVGLGALAGVLAMGIRSIGFISKTVAEAIEDVNPGPVEAMRAVGANRFQVLLFGILPQVIPVFIGNVIFEWDVNIRRSTIMGLVGAGGLGLALHRQMSAYNYGGVATVLLVILLLIIAGEIASYLARRAVI
ncbi:MAG: phosphonate ABC transporter, permease protein PhnE [Betaproteobacteria bacterium]|jgi:phosphonate transport system permease protein|nr:phosphonate ABC transporter, permease protein PhnE [Betaproteobacteria bacterium]